MVAVPASRGNPTGGPGGRGNRILVVDDVRHIARLMQVNLERAGYEVITAFDGRKALESIAADKPDMVIVDALMPYMDGFEVIKTLRMNVSTSSLPIIIVKSLSVDVAHIANSGADFYLEKPFNSIELLTLVRRLFDESRSRLLKE